MTEQERVMLSNALGLSAPPEGEAWPTFEELLERVKKNEEMYLELKTALCTSTKTVLRYSDDMSDSLETIRDLRRKVAEYLEVLNEYHARIKSMASVIQSMSDRIDRIVQ